MRSILALILVLLATLSIASQIHGLENRVENSSRYEIYAIRWSPEGGLLAVAGIDLEKRVGFLELYRVEHGELVEVSRIGLGKTMVLDLDWSPNGDFIALKTLDQVVVIDRNGTELRRVGVEGTRICWTRSGKYIAVGVPTLTILEIVDGSLRKIFDLGQSTVTQIACGRDRIYAIADHRTLLLIDPGKERRVLTLRDLGFENDGEILGLGVGRYLYIYVRTSSQDYVLFVNTSTLRIDDVRYVEYPSMLLAGSGAVRVEEVGKAIVFGIDSQNPRMCTVPKIVVGLGSGFLELELNTSVSRFDIDAKNYVFAGIGCNGSKIVVLDLRPYILGAYLASKPSEGIELLYASPYLATFPSLRVSWSPQGGRILVHNPSENSIAVFEYRNGEIHPLATFHRTPLMNPVWLDDERVASFEGKVLNVVTNGLTKIEGIALALEDERSSLLTSTELYDVRRALYDDSRYVRMIRFAHGVPMPVINYVGTWRLYLFKATARGFEKIAEVDLPIEGTNFVLPTTACVDGSRVTVHLLIDVNGSWRNVVAILDLHGKTKLVDVSNATSKILEAVGREIDVVIERVTEDLRRGYLSNLANVTFENESIAFVEWCSIDSSRNAMYVAIKPFVIVKAVLGNDTLYTVFERLGTYLALVSLNGSLMNAKFVVVGEPKYIASLIESIGSRILAVFRNGTVLYIDEKLDVVKRGSLGCSVNDIDLKKIGDKYLLAVANRALYVFDITKLLKGSTTSITIASSTSSSARRVPSTNFTIVVMATLIAVATIVLVAMTRTKRRG